MLLALLLFSLLLLVLLGFYVFVAAPRSRPHQTFAAFVACLALWTIKDLVFWGFFDRTASPGWWVGSSFAIALLMQYSLVVFAWVFPENHPFPLRRAAIVFAPGLILIPAALAGLVWQTVGFTGDRLEIKLTPLAYIYVAYVYGVFAYGFWILVTKYRRYRGTQPGQQLAAIIWALVITGALKTVANVVLPFFGNYDLLKIGAVFVLPGVIIYAYAISNFKLFTFSSTLDQFRLFPIAFKVAISIAAVAVLSFVLVQLPIVWWSFHEGNGAQAWRRYVVFSIIGALLPNLILVALIVRSLSRPVRELTIAALRVSGGEYGAQVQLRTNDEMGLLAESFNQMSGKMAADIDQLRQLNEHLLRTEKLAAAGTLAAGVAHEVNNPLASISSLIQILQARSDNDEESAEMLRLIATQITRISQITRDLMEFARSRPSRREPTDLRAVIESSLRLANFDRAFGRLSITTSFGEELPPVLADAGQLQQVVLNLLLNARDAMPEGGMITVATHFEPAANEVVIQVTDTGPGIAPEHRAQIFDPFFSTKSAGQGTGLGLAVCYGIVRAHGGRIELLDDDYAGATISLSLPGGDEQCP